MSLDGRVFPPIDISAAQALKGRELIHLKTGQTRTLGAAAPLDNGLLKVLIQPDAHYPFQDKRACELVYRVAERLKPDILIVLGDHFDFWGISDHRKDPRRRADMEWEVQEGDKGLQEYEKLGVFRRMIFCEGNHEWRLTRYIADKASEVYQALAPAGLLSTRSLPEALNFKARGWEWVPYMTHGRIGRLHFTHDMGKAGKTAHESAQQDFETSSVIGHTHHMRLMVRGNHRGQWSTGAMFGWLGDYRQIDYRPKMKVRREWPLGFGMAYIEKSTDLTHIVPTLIHTEKRRYRCVVEGRSFMA